MGVNGLLLDLDGVFYIGEELVPGASETLSALRDAGIARRFVTNTSTKTSHELVAKLHALGLDVDADEVFSAVTATRLYLETQLIDGRLPSLHLLLREAALPEFDYFPGSGNGRPDIVVVGDIGAAWSYDLLNQVFRELMDGARLVAMHKNKFWQGPEGLRLDIGAFVAGLEYVTGVEAVVIGKPSKSFYEMALASLGLSADRVAMVGDDIESDVGGSQAAGLAGILVKTGKYRDAHADQSDIVPDAVIDSIADLPGWLATQSGDAGPEPGTADR
jgi:HAD superfamily hydrolase (TIGR01458 family)